MIAVRSKRERLAGWLWEMYARSCREAARAEGLGQHHEAEHFKRQAKTIANILAQMTRAEHPIER